MLPAGTRLGPFEIQAPIGAGGMGEVYRATDTRLGRLVAIKVLPEGVADAQSLTRFEQEARAASALNHPNIVTVHEIGREGATTYIALELVAGQSLRDALAAGPFPLKRALQIAAQLADGLAAAHERGIVHRDLKPENVMVTKDGLVKILDFGLAKLAPPLGGEVSALETTPQVTAAGTVLGTIGYMSPEQASGRTADFRSDQFSLGAILYELVTGRRAFQRKTAAETLAALIREEPEPIEATRPQTPTPLRWTIERCLEKEPDQRFVSTRDLARDLANLRDRLSEASTSSSVVAVPATRGRRRKIAAAGAIFAVAAALVLVFRPRTPQRAAPMVTFEMPPPPGTSFSGSVETTTLAVSPDGSRIAFTAAPLLPARGQTAGAGPRGIYVRRLSDLDARPLPGTERASSIFWSPDGRSIAFFAGDKLKRIDAASGASAVQICDVPAGVGKSGTWGADGEILFTVIQGSTVWRVRAEGGVPEPLIKDPPGMRLCWPWFLPDGKRFLYHRRRSDGTADVMLAQRGAEPRALLSLASAPQYVDPDTLVFAQEGALVARPFDARAGRVSGEPLPIAPHVQNFVTNGHASFGASRAGTIAFQAHENVSRLGWFDATGREVGALGSHADYQDLWISRDGRRLFTDRREPATGAWDVWSIDVERGVETRITSSPTTEVAAIEPPDRKSLVYAATRGGGQPQLYRLVDGREERLAPGDAVFQFPQDLSPDGRTLVYQQRTPASPFDIWALDLTGATPPRPLLQSPFQKYGVRFSPDGRFLSFTSDESGHGEIYVMPFGKPAERSRVSTNGAHLARWAPDGTQLYYLSNDNRLMSAPVATQPSLTIGAPRELFELPAKSWRNFDVAPDGKRFLAIVPEVLEDEAPLTVIVGWRPEPR